jgi:hypothetical protein
MSATDPTFDDILHESTPDIADIARKMRALILDVAPGVTETISIKDRVAGYGYSAKMRQQLVYIALPKDWARLGFYRGGELPDPNHLLEGEGKLLRHIKIRTAEDLDMPAVRKLLQQALKDKSVS